MAKFEVQMKSVPALVFVACCLVPVVVGCGDDDSGGGSANSQTENNATVNNQPANNDVGDPLALQHNPFIDLPAVQGMAAGDSVTVTTVLSTGKDGSTGFEMLGSGMVYVAWAVTADGYVQLGELDPGVDLVGQAAGATGIALSIESATSIGDEPTSVFIEGPIGEDLLLGDLKALSFSNARAEVVMDWDWIEASYTGLPELPAGFVYQLWAVELDASGAPVGNDVPCATFDTLPDGAADRYTDSALPPLFELRVTIEAVDGVPAMSDTVCLKLQHDHSQHMH